MRRADLERAIREGLCDFYGYALYDPEDREVVSEATEAILSRIEAVASESATER